MQTSAKADNLSWGKYMMGNTEKVKQLLPADINDEAMCRLAVNIAIVETLQKLYAHNFMFYSNTYFLQALIGVINLF